MPIDSPKRPEDHPDRNIDCQMALEQTMLYAIDQAMQVGWKLTEIFPAIEELARNIHLAYLEDPDPADEIASDATST